MEALWLYLQRNRRGYGLFYEHSYDPLHRRVSAVLARVDGDTGVQAHIRQVGQLYTRHKRGAHIQEVVGQPLLFELARLFDHNFIDRLLRQLHALYGGCIGVGARADLD